VVFTVAEACRKVESFHTAVMRVKQEQVTVDENMNLRASSSSLSSVRSNKLMQLITFLSIKRTSKYKSPKTVSRRFVDIPHAATQEGTIQNFSPK